MDINDFISLEDEAIVEPEEDLLDHLAEIHSKVQDDEAVIEEEERELPVIPVRNALAGLETFLEFEMQQDDAQFDLLTRLRRRLKDIRRKEENTRKQGNLDAFINLGGLRDIIR